MFSWREHRFPSSLRCSYRTTYYHGPESNGSLGVSQCSLKTVTSTSEPCHSRQNSNYSQRLRVRSKQCSYGSMTAATVRVSTSYRTGPNAERGSSRPGRAHNQVISRRNRFSIHMSLNRCVDDSQRYGAARGNGWTTSLDSYHSRPSATVPRLRVYNSY